MKASDHADFLLDERAHYKKKANALLVAATVLSALHIPSVVFLFFGEPLEVEFAITFAVALFVWAVAINLFTISNRSKRELEAMENDD